MPNYYETLGVDIRASQYQIQAGYHKLVKKWHPDKYRGSKLVAQRKLAEINKAYETLRNEDQRKIYDKENRIGAPINPFANIVYSDIDSDSDAPIDMEKFKQRLKDINNVLRAQGVDIKSDTESEDNNYGGAQESLGDFMKKYKSKGSDAIVYLDVTLEDIYRGTLKKVKVTKKMPNGKTKNEMVNVRVGVTSDDGDSITVTGAGNHITYDNKVASEPGDAIFYINVKDHPIYKRRSCDLFTTINITSDEAMNGFKKTLKGIDKKSFTINVKKLNKSSDVHIVKGRGLRKNATGMAFGNVHVSFVILFNSEKNKSNGNASEKESEPESDDESEDEKPIKKQSKSAPKKVVKTKEGKGDTD
jgi:DnaJ-class molecular chaperone